MEEERPPEAIYYFRIYAVVMLLCLLGGFGSGLYMMLEPLMKRIGTPSAGDWIGGAILMCISGFFMVPHAIVLFGGRAKWVYTLATVLIGMSMLWNMCCLPITLPLLIVWMKPETKKWYGVN